MKTRPLPAHRSGRKGFSLVELCVTIAVIGIMASIALPILLNDNTALKDIARRKNAQSIASISSMARAAGDVSLTTTTDKMEAVKKLMAGVVGKGTMQTTEFKLSKLKDEDITDALSLLELSGGVFVVK